MNNKIILVGAGGHCKSVIDVVESNGFTIVGILGVAEEVNQYILNYEVIGTDDQIPEFVDKAFFVITVGQIKNSNLRLKIYNKIIAAGGKLITIISPYSHVSRHATIGEGTVVLHNVIINAGATIGKCCIINTFANIEHDSVIGDFCHISTGAMINGGVKVGKHSFIGSNSMIRQNSEIKSYSFIGGGVCTELNCSFTQNSLINPEREKIIIIGSSGLAKEIAFLLESINQINNNWDFLGYIDKAIGVYNGKYKIFNTDEWLLNCNEKINVVFGVGDPLLISKLHNKFKNNPNLNFPNIIHPNATGDWKRIKLGQGNIITSNVNFTTDIKIGSFNLFNLSCTVGHDTVIGNYNVFNPSVNISGGIIIDNEILIGTGAQVLQYKKITSNVVIGAGSVVTKDITESGVYVGIPATLVKK